MVLKFVDEYRDGKLANQYAEKIANLATRPWKIMEICGGQTHSIVKYGIDQLLSPLVTLIHGPGCPVCVTPQSIIDLAIQLASTPGVIFCSFGDMLRVPGSSKDLLTAKAEGAQVRMVYSPLDALQLACDNPDRQVVFFAVGFETTAPANAMAVYQAKKQGIHNFSLLVSQVLVPPGVESILSASYHSPHESIHGLLAPGHVCTIVGYREYENLSCKYKIPIVVTGFEPADILQGIAMCIAQLEQGRAVTENQYTRAVNRKGNQQAKAIIAEIFEVVPQVWRGLGRIPASGLKLSLAYRAWDAEYRFSLRAESEEVKSECISGSILQGVKKPYECSEFGRNCYPEHPLGAPMVSSEGACAAYYHYRRGSQKE